MCIFIRFINVSVLGRTLKWNALDCADNFFQEYINKRIIFIENFRAYSVNGYILYQWSPLCLFFLVFADSIWRKLVTIKIKKKNGKKWVTMLSALKQCSFYKVFSNIVHRIYKSIQNPIKTVTYFRKKLCLRCDFDFAAGITICRNFTVLQLKEKQSDFSKQWYLL